MEHLKKSFFMSFDGENLYLHFQQKKFLDYLDSVKKPSLENYSFKEFFQVKNFHEFLKELDQFHYFLFSQSVWSEDVYRFVCAMIHFLVDLFKFKYSLA